jgi:plastocyanin
MRKLLVGAAVMAAGLVPVALVASGAGAGTAAKGKPPIKLSGKVTNQGTAVASGGSIELHQDDFDYEPTFVQVPKGTTSVTVTIKNVGQAQHTFTVPADHIDQVVNPGQTFVETVALPQKGAVGFYCRFHKSQGMQGAFFSKKGDKVVKAVSSTSGANTGGGGSSSGY